MSRFIAQHDYVHTTLLVSSFARSVRHHRRHHWLRRRRWSVLVVVAVAVRIRRVRRVRVRSVPFACVRHFQRLRCVSCMFRYVFVISAKLVDIFVIVIAAFVSIADSY